MPQRRRFTADLGESLQRTKNGSNCPMLPPQPLQLPGRARRQRPEADLHPSIHRHESNAWTRRQAHTARRAPCSSSALRAPPALCYTCGYLATYSRVDAAGVSLHSRAALRGWDQLAPHSPAPGPATGPAARVQDPGTRRARPTTPARRAPAAPSRNASWTELFARARSHCHAGHQAGPHYGPPWHPSCIRARAVRGSTSTQAPPPTAAQRRRTAAPPPPPFPPCTPPSRLPLPNMNRAGGEGAQG
jgi:hypothetical protein